MAAAAFSHRRIQHDPSLFSLMLSIPSLLTLTWILVATLISRVSALLVHPRPPSTRRNPGGRLHAIREATFGAGCFWEPSESLLKCNGVLDTVAGYAGGSLGGGPKPLQPPTYDDVCAGDAWVESVRVAYDDDVLPYAGLLERFWMAQRPQEGGGRQYQSFIFPADEVQYDAAREWFGAATEEGRERESDGLPISVVSIEYDAGSKAEEGVLFYRAEEYHQEFWKKWRTRIGVAAFLLSTSVDLSIVHASAEAQAQWHVGTAIVLAAGGLYYGIVERILDDSVRELQPGEFAGLAAAAKSKKP